MRRTPLFWVTLLLVGVVLVDVAVRVGARQGREPAPAATADPGAPEPQAPGAPAPRRAPLGAAVPSPEPPSPAVRLARLALRDRLRAAGPGTYLDSLIRTSDSIVRRWADGRASLTLALVPGGVKAWDPAYAALVREAAQRWNETGLGPAWRVVDDSARADVVVQWVDRFDFARAGQTDLMWDNGGVVRRAYVTLALADQADHVLAREDLAAIALHELGHALGLPHSDAPSDIMFPSTSAGRLSERDRATLRLLYELPPGSLRDGAP
ncbi:MAG: matrixin family metalloprotease [Gemmatimonadales bacterium]|nr:matrixin family metalloprotease [Gemmatimonadales bacterium]